MKLLDEWHYELHPNIESLFKMRLEKKQKYREKYAIPICGILGIIMVFYFIIIKQGLFIITGLPVLFVFVYGLIIYVDRYRKGHYDGLKEQIENLEKKWNSLLESFIN